MGDDASFYGLFQSHGVMPDLGAGAPPLLHYAPEGHRTTRAPSTPSVSLFILSYILLFYIIRGTYICFCSFVFYWVAMFGLFFF